MNQIPYGGPTNIGHHWIKLFSRVPWCLGFCTSGLRRLCLTHFLCSLAPISICVLNICLPYS